MGNIFQMVRGALARGSAGEIPPANKGLKTGFAESGGDGWSYTKEGQRIGPAPLDEIKRLIESGAIGANTLVSKAGQLDWVPLSATELGAILDQRGAAPAVQGAWLKYVKHALAKLFDLSGRASRSEYWWAVLSFLVPLLAILFIIGFIAIITDINSLWVVFLTISILSYLAISICIICLTARRLHDIDLSGWFYLLKFFPGFGDLFMLVVALLPSRPPNQFGGGPWRPAP